MRVAENRFTMHHQDRHPERRRVMESSGSAHVCDGSARIKVCQGGRRMRSHGNGVGATRFQ